MLRSLVVLFSVVPAFSAFAAGGGGGHSVDPRAVTLFPHQSTLSFLTNSVFVAAVVTLLILWFVRRAMRRPQLIPDQRQNLVETVVEFLYQQTENMLGPKVAKQAFPLLATIFVFFTVANWFGLLPGVGTIGFSEHTDGWMTDHVDRPLLRPATADMNMTLGVALCAFVIWFVITIRELGFMGLVHHTFGPKGGLEGFLKNLLMPIFLFVGFIEVISIVVRPLTLSLRLYGNVYAGESLLHAMGSLGDTFGMGPVLKFISSVVFQLPFYFLEILVGILQGMVFAMLNAVYIKLSTSHDEEHGEGHGAH